MEPLDFLLFTDIKSAKSLATSLNILAKNFMLPAFLLGVIWENITFRFDFKSVILRLFLAIFVMNFFSPYHNEMRKESMKIGNAILKRHGSGNKFIRGWKAVMKSKQGRQIRKNSKEDGRRYDGYFKNLVKSYSNDIVLGLLWVLNYLALLLVKILYTVVYHFADVTAGIAAVMSMLPFARNAAMGPIKASFWCFLVPILTACILSAMGSLISPPGVENGFIVYDTGTYVQMFIFSILLFGVFGFTNKLISGEGIQTWAEGIGDKATMATILGAGSLAMKPIRAATGYTRDKMTATGMAIGGSLIGSTLRGIGGGLNKARNLVGDKAGRELGNAGLNPTVSELNSSAEMSNKPGLAGSIGNSVDNAYKETGSLRQSVLSPKSISIGVGEGMKNYRERGAKAIDNSSKFINQTDGKTKTLSVADKIMNGKSSRDANVARGKFADTMKNNPQLQNLALPNSAFRNESNYNKFLGENNIRSAPQFHSLNRQPTQFNKKPSGKYSSRYKG